MAEANDCICSSLQVIEPMVRLVNLLMRDEGPDTAIEEVPDASDDVLKPDETHVFVSADGTAVTQSDWIQGETQDVGEEPDKASQDVSAQEEEEPYVPFKRDPPPPQIDSEDEEEMLLEV